MNRLKRRFPSLALSAVCAALAVAFAGLAFAQQRSSVPANPDEAAQSTDLFETATVVRIEGEKQDAFAGINRTVQTAVLRIDSGPDKGTEFTAENGVLEGRDDMRLQQGETVVVDKQVKVDGSVQYLIQEKYRLPAMFWLTVLFVAMSVVFGGITGITSIIGLAVSVAVIVWFVIPRVVAGSDPLTVSLIGCVLIACTSLYFAHGFNKRTSIALLSTTVTLGIAAFLAVFFVDVARLFGMGSEESLYLQTGALQNINLKGLLLGGIIIGCLGVLDDVTTAQTAAIDEISKANPRLTAAELRAAGRSVGKEHIASLINTLALAYVGTSLPLLLLIKTQNDSPLWLTINSEFLAEEIIRTLVGSATLLVAVPISTWFAAYFLQGGRGGDGSWGHSHAHGHTHAAAFGMIEEPSR